MTDDNDDERQEARTPPFKPLSPCKMDGDAVRHTHTKEDTLQDVVPLTISACPHSTIDGKFGAVFGRESGGGKGSLAYEENVDGRDDTTVNEITRTSVDLLKSPRQTRAPPGTPQCGDLAEFCWQEGTFVGKARTSTASTPPALWGLPYSDTFGTLRAIDSIDVQQVSKGECSVGDDDDDDDETNKENRPPHDKSSDSQRRNSFFSFHLTTSLMRASKKLRNRNSIGAGQGES